MTLIDELRTIAKTVDFHLGAGTSAEGRAAAEIERLQRRVEMLESVIRENLDLPDSGGGPNRKLVEEIVQEHAGQRKPSHVTPAPPALPRAVDLLAALAAELSRSAELPHALMASDLDGRGAYATAPREPVAKRPASEPARGPDPNPMRRQLQPPPLHHRFRAQFECQPDSG
jgi:hypothetical protein